MAAVLELTDGTTTLDLRGATYSLLRGGLSMPCPPHRQVVGGSGLFRDGADLVDVKLENREITIALRVKSTTADGLAAAVAALNQMLQAARDYATRGIGAQVTLDYAWDGATTTVHFSVLDGALDLPPTVSDLEKQADFLVYDATLRLICAPYALGDDLTLENYGLNSHFDLITGGALDGYTLIDVTLAQETTDKETGTQSGVITCNDAGGVADSRAYMRNVWAAAYQGQQFTLAVRYKSTGDKSKRAYIWDGVGLTAVALNAAQSTWAWATVTRTLDAAATMLECDFTVKQEAAVDIDDTLTIDRWILAKAATAPQTAWIGSREVRNNNEQPEGAGYENRVNWVDILEVPGDVPALTKLYVVPESAVSTKLAVGVRSGSNRRADALWFEGEDFAGPPAAAAIVDATASAGKFGRLSVAGTGAVLLWSTTDISALAAKGGLFAIFARARSDSTTTSMGVGWSFGGVVVAPPVADMVAIPQTTFALLQIGTLVVPPAAVPSDDLAASALLLRLYGRDTAAVANVDVDYVLLVPVDEAGVLATKASAADRLLIDGTGAQPGVYLLDASEDVSGLPTDWSGRPPQASPLGSRFHVLTDAAVNTTLPIRAVITPRYLAVG